MGSLYDHTEFMSVPEYLRHTYGTDEPPSGHGAVWQLNLVGKATSSYNFFANNFAYIADKKGTFKTLRPFVGQAIHRVALDSQLKAGLPGRLCEVKARQLGWTTENVARALHFILDENKKALILVDDEDVATEQAERLYTMLNGLPQFLQPMRQIQNLKHLRFDNPNAKDRIAHPGLNSTSHITVPTSFRGIGGAICVIVSEYAHMDEQRQEAVNMGLISAIPLTPYTILIIDTTPNGPGDSYHRMVEKAVEANPKWSRRIEGWKGELCAEDVLAGALGIPDCVERKYPNKMVPAICPWRLHEEYSAKCKTTPLGELPPMTKALRGELESTLGKIAKYGGEEELDLRDRFGVIHERLFWRRVKIDGYELPSDEMNLLAFRQEFLSTIEGAFQDTGQTPFARDSIDAIMRQQRTPAAVGLFEREDEFAYWEKSGESITHIHRDPNPWQEIRIYAPPQNGQKYVMGVDVANTAGNTEADATVAQIIRVSDWKLVATLKSRLGAFEIIKQLQCLYRWYFNCLYAIEAAGLGFTLIRLCIDDAKMANTYYYSRLDKDSPEPTSFPGWDTSKPFMRSLMDETLLRMVCHRDPQTGKADPLCNIPDLETIQEIRGLRRQPSGAYKAPNGRHDDHVDALEIAWCVAQDPRSGLLVASREQKERERLDFEAQFKWMKNGHRYDRNRPDLSQL